MNSILWGQLTDPEQTTLRLVYEVDQAQEMLERGQWQTRRVRARPASVWRWIFYGERLSGPSPLKRRLGEANIANHGAILDDLERNQLLVVRFPTKKRNFGGAFDVQILPAGRKLVRASSGEKREKPLPAGTLRKWHWESLVALWESRHLPEYEMGHGVRRFEDWQRLYSYKWGALVNQENTHITLYGEEFYRANWQKYRKLYPEVLAPAPDEEETADATAVQ